MARLALTALAVLGAMAWRGTLQAQAAPELQGGLEIKWLRDSEEFAAQSRMVYRMAERSVTAAARGVPRGRAWAVVLDIDETTLDNSTYQLTRQAYRLPYDTASWNEFTRRVESNVVPGVAEFIASVRRLGGRVAWISNRYEPTAEATRANLRRFNLWNDDDRLCVRTAESSKAARRAEVAAGSGACGWNGMPMTVLAFIGDNIQDFPQAGENDPDAGPNDAVFGTRFFMIANPMYGDWVTRVTRKDR